jgi:hypothetical protein
MSTHLNKLLKYFLKYREYGINLNPKKCVFMVCFWTTSRFIISEEGKTLHPKMIKFLIKMLVPKTPQKLKSSMAWHNFVDVSLETFLLLWH